MRPGVFGLLSLMTLMVGGCSHLSAVHPDNRAPAPASATERLGAAKHADGSHKHGVNGWETVTTSEGPADERQSPPSHGTGWKTVNWTPETINHNWSDPIITPVSNAKPHAVAHTDGVYYLDSGDQLRIFVYGQPNLSRIYTVDYSGKIMVPLIGVVRARRRTTRQLAGVIRARLGAKYVRDPQVTVDIQQNRPFFILGEVRNPGQYPYVNGMTVETAVAIAGGYTPRASKHKFRISRRVDGVVEVAKGDVDYVIRPGDTIKVRERFF